MGGRRLVGFLLFCLSGVGRTLFLHWLVGCIRGLLASFFYDFRYEDFTVCTGGQFHVAFARVCPFIYGIGLRAISVISFLVLVSFLCLDGSDICVGFQDRISAILNGRMEEVDDARFTSFLSFVDRVTGRRYSAGRYVAAMITNQVSCSAISFAASGDVNYLRLYCCICFTCNEDVVFRAVLADRVARDANEARIEGDIAQDVFRCVVNGDGRYVFFAVRCAILTGRDRAIGIQICCGDCVDFSAFRRIRSIARILFG